MGVNEHRNAGATKRMRINGVFNLRLIIKILFITSVIVDVGACCRPEPTPGGLVREGIEMSTPRDYISESPKEIDLGAYKLYGHEQQTFCDHTYVTGPASLPHSTASQAPPYPLSPYP